ncbi:hypothetical protein Tco_0455193 [Tanacetum coccineum]
MSRDVITVGLTMRISLLYRGEYSQWRERFLNYLEEQTNGEAMIRSITHGEQPLHVVTQVSLAGNAPNAPLNLKSEINKYDPTCPVCTFGEKKVIKLSKKALKAEFKLITRMGKKSRNGVVDDDMNVDVIVFLFITVFDLCMCLFILDKQMWV